MENFVFCAVKGTLPLSVPIAGLDTITLHAGNILVMYCFTWSNSSRICPDFFEKSSFVPIFSIMCSGFVLSNGARWCLRSSIVTPVTRKVSVFEVILVCIFPHWDWICTRTTPNTDTLYAVSEISNSTIWFILESRFSLVSVNIESRTFKQVPAGHNVWNCQKFHRCWPYFFLLLYSEHFCFTFCQPIKFAQLHYRQLNYFFIFYKINVSFS